MQELVAFTLNAPIALAVIGRLLRPFHTVLKLIPQGSL